MTEKKETDKKVVQYTKELALVNSIFEEVRVKINQYKLDGKLIYSDAVIFPYVLGFLTEAMRSFIESTHPDKKDEIRRMMAEMVRQHLEEVMDWPTFLKLTE